MVRHGFSLAEVVVALVIFTIGALGAVALTAQMVRVATGSLRYEAAVLQAATLLDSLTAANAESDGAMGDRNAAYRWRIRVDSTGRRIEVVARVRASTDTIRLSAHRPAPPPLLRARP